MNYMNKIWKLLQGFLSFQIISAHLQDFPVPQQSLTSDTSFAQSIHMDSEVLKQTPAVIHITKSYFIKVSNHPCSHVVSSH